ncbi:MAG: hypothetical protein FLDDKLPJ_01177 [Phycisphaerae bacterium]|nr:hypothetical protein [Phycisphaerae bacterium]
MAKRRSRGRTLRQIVSDLRRDAADNAWRRATLASRLRHAAAQMGQSRSSRVLGEIKRAALERVAELVPDEVGMTIDSDRHIGLVSVRWNGHGRLHLPADVQVRVRPSAPANRSA